MSKRPPRKRGFCKFLQFSRLALLPIIEKESISLVTAGHLHKMSYVAKEDKEGLEGGYSAKSHKIRITLTSHKVKAIEKVCVDLVNRAKDKELRVKGPVRLPTKVLTHTTRKTPCGEGSKTWDRYEMKIHKRLIDLTSPSEIVKQIVHLATLLRSLCLQLIFPVTDIHVNRTRAMDPVSGMHRARIHVRPVAGGLATGQAAHNATARQMAPPLGRISNIAPFNTKNPPDLLQHGDDFIMPDPRTASPQQPPGTIEIPGIVDDVQGATSSIAVKPANQEFAISGDIPYATSAGNADFKVLCGTTFSLANSTSGARKAT
ncbi:MAG: 40S ribosomal protein S20 [Cyphobasidiales sp. Tagirdzhanova-0007]|nr:MAG: 40S ribosomal protein S20 [Cyphobasidiales sp. Tagirdzhanova-0007]